MRNDLVFWYAEALQSDKMEFSCHFTLAKVETLANRHCCGYLMKSFYLNPKMWWEGWASKVFLLSEAQHCLCFYQLVFHLFKSCSQMSVTFLSCFFFFFAQPVQQQAPRIITSEVKVCHFIVCIVDNVDKRHMYAPQHVFGQNTQKCAHTANSFVCLVFCDSSFQPIIFVLYFMYVAMQSQMRIN